MENKIKQVCPVCKKKFTRYKCQLKKAQAYYCSQDCAYKGRSLGFTKRRIKKPYKIIHSLKRRFKKDCLVCGNGFETIKSRIDRKYCSRRCFEIAHHYNMVGPKNPSWKDGSSYNKRCWRGIEWNILRRIVYERDNWTCQICGIKCGQKEIQCHHIVKWKTSHDNSLNNLITLCVSCHSKIDQGGIDVRFKNKHSNSGRLYGSDEILAREFHRCDMHRPALTGS